MEIERKFLVNEKIYDIDLNQYEKEEISQFYLFRNPEFRVRKCNDKYYATYKSHGTLIREEKEVRVNRSFFNNYKMLANGKVIEKTRYKIPTNDGLVIEVDFYHSYLEGLKVAEIEFKDINQAEKFKEFPNYFDKEITNDLRYKNKNLSKVKRIPK